LSPEVLGTLFLERAPIFNADPLTVFGR